MSLLDLLITAIVIFAVVKSISYLIRDHRSGCGGYCAACPHKCQQVKKKA
ncbi:MAG: FeoB-associated Cys-rich membrane protein [Erysipelotrichaceae bacterium]|nr:FeoB-associated Cys-rich membrane protein [Erysipelotrichaceae bacterium]